MTRRTRLALPGLAHLVLQHGHSGRAAFLDDADRRAYLDALHEAAAASGVTVHAWSLADAQARLLLTPESPDGLSRAMQSLGRRYAAVHNRRHGRSGTPWDGRFRCGVVEPGPWRLQALRWVDGDGGSGAVTSAAARTGRPGVPLSPDARVRHPPEYWALGNTPFEREAAYAVLLDAGVPPQAASALARAARGGWACGSPAFAAELALRLGRRMTPGAAGRPVGSTTRARLRQSIGSVPD